MSEVQILSFKDDCKRILIHFMQNFLLKSPLQYALVKNVACLDPQILLSDKVLAVGKMKKILYTYVNKRGFNAQDCDLILDEFSEFIDSATASGALSSFSKENDRLDEFYFNLLSSSAYSALWGVVKEVLLLSHGQAGVERGFSINKELEDPSLAEGTLIAKRLIVDFVRSKGGVNNVQITPELLVSAGSAYRKYQQHLESEKEKEKQNKRAQKRKAFECVIEEMKSKRAALNKDIQALRESADKYSERAEKERNFSHIAHANSLRQKIKEKQVEESEVEKQLDEKLLELKNSV